eukprot:4316039-Amphidinium_carterae.1
MTDYSMCSFMDTLFRVRKRQPPDGRKSSIWHHHHQQQQQQQQQQRHCSYGKLLRMRWLNCLSGVPILHSSFALTESKGPLRMAPRERLTDRSLCVKTRAISMVASDCAGHAARPPDSILVVTRFFKKPLQSVTGQMPITTVQAKDRSHSCRRQQDISAMDMLKVLLCEADNLVKNKIWNKALLCRQRSLKNLRKGVVGEVRFPAHEPFDKVRAADRVKVDASIHLQAQPTVFGKRQHACEKRLFGGA